MRFAFRCPQCGREYPGHTKRWRCPCGAPFALGERLPFSKEAIDGGRPTMWRYRAMIPVDHIVSLGEGHTPLVEVELYGCRILCKLEFLSPTGSFKDRSTSVLVSALAEMGVERALDDSSGNAGASLAAYCARAGIEAQIFVPAQASRGKLAQIEAYGAQLVPVPGPRERAAEEVSKAKGYYASHYWNPLVLEGLKTSAYEICEDLGWQAPENIVLPLGQGTHLLGLNGGFRDLLEARVITRMPRLYGVQAEACAPLYYAYRGRAAPPPRPTVAEGISIASPIHRQAIVEAVRATEGDILIVDDEETLQACLYLARRGLYVEPTSAAAVAALPQIKDRLSPGETVIPLTGSGLKWGGQDEP